MEKTLQQETPSLYPICKRCFDVIFSICVLTFLSPLLLFIAFLIKVSSKGNVLYSSVRIGKDYKKIYCLKFRTMYVDADERLGSLLEKCPKLKDEWQRYQKLKKDPRVTFIGRILRKTSLDEFPQFFDVIKGDLSVVGPRPFCENQIDDYLGSKAPKFLSIKPGITGIWQVSGRNLLTFKERMILEEAYIENLSFYQDLWIILKTVPAVIFPKGAF
ncbi:exopolysaccharide biosynthesis protein [Candidatus Aerophobetes bacterium]|uniref:Exopolysaccharide biosynthesis protein n=1 Tax=Aerophobetes bacterium TaxID=2030807 RepID=A0A2A4YC27_UNCAE|nr:MAG: exopolysaccharide biosynthesis protein [Candidatus Aerophobetes bacterium]